MAEKKTTMSVALANPFVKSLSGNLNLTQAQEMRARSSALTLSSTASLANCDPFSIIKYCFETVRYNFGRDDCIYPVPYKNFVQAQVGYRGYRELAMRTGKYQNIDASEVYECDKIKRNRITGQIEVEFEEDVSKIDTTKVQGYYAFAIDKNGALVGTKYMSQKECEAWGKKYSKTYGKTWENNFKKMALKTVIKQLCGSLESSVEMQNLQKQDQIVYGGLNEKDTYKDNANVIDAEAQETTINNSIIEEGTENDN